MVLVRYIYVMIDRLSDIYIIAEIKSIKYKRERHALKQLNIPNKLINSSNTLHRLQ